MTKPEYTVLIVDDNPDDRSSLRRYLERVPDVRYRYVDAETVDVGLQLCHTIQPDVILLDYHLPDDTGLEFLEALRASDDRPSCAVLMLTGQGNEAVAVAALQRGAHDYLTKTADLERRLSPHILKALERVQRERDRATQRHMLAARHSDLQAAHQAAAADHRLLAAHTARLEVLSQAARIFAAAGTDEQAVLDAVASTLATHLQSRCQIWLLSADGRSLVPAAMALVGPAVDALSSSLKSSPTIAVDSAEPVAQLARSGRARLLGLADLAQQPPAQPPLLWPGELTSGIGCPLTVQGRVVGVLTLMRSVVDQPLFGAADLWLVEDLVGRAGLALANARLYTSAVHTHDALAAQASARRESDERFQLMVDAAEEYALFLLDPAGRVVTWNRGAERIKGYSADDIIGQHFGCFYTANDRARGWPAQLLATARAGGSVSDEGWRVRRDGSQFWASVVLTALRDADGNLRGFSKLTRDMTERKRAEEALRLSHAMLANAGAGIYLVRASDGLIIQTNPCLDQLFGYAPGELLGAHVSQLNVSGEHTVGPTTADVVDALQREGRWQGEVESRRKDGSTFWCASQVTTFAHTEYGQVWVAACQDITDRRQAEAARSRAARRLAILAEASHALAAAGVDVQVVLEQVAQTMVDTLGQGCVVGLLSEDGQWLHGAAIRAAEPHGQTLLETVLGGPQPIDGASISLHVVRTQQPVLIATIEPDTLSPTLKPEYGALVLDLQLRSIVSVPLRLQARPLGVLTLFRYGNAREPFDADDLALAQDLADRAALALDKSRLYRAAQDALQARDSVFAGVAHDLKNPLLALAGFNQVLRRRLQRSTPPDPAALLSVLTKSDESIGRMNGMLGELLDTARLEGGHALDLELQQVDVAALLRRQVEQLQTTTTTHTIELQSDAGALYAAVDAVRIERVIANLLGNAVKYSRPGSVIRAAITAEAAERSWVVLSVTDAGMGIPRADQAHLFKRFYRAGNVRGIKGTGIGLASAYQIVAQHGGTITFESHEGAGTTFWVRLPALAG